MLLTSFNSISQIVYVDIIVRITSSHFYVWPMMVIFTRVRGWGRRESHSTFFFLILTLRTYRFRSYQKKSRPTPQIPPTLDRLHQRLNRRTRGRRRPRHDGPLTIRLNPKHTSLGRTTHRFLSYFDFVTMGVPLGIGRTLRASAEGWDLAGVEGEWRRVVCCMDHPRFIACVLSYSLIQTTDPCAQFIE